MRLWALVACLVAAWRFGWLWLSPRLGAWRRAGAVRARLGPAHHSQRALRNGEVVTLVGRLELEGEACSRIEGGDGAAVAEAETRQGQRLADAVARGALVVALDDARVALHKPLRLLVGSRELFAGGDVRGLAPWLRARIPLRDAAPAGEVVFRSLAPRDRVLVRGVARRVLVEGPASYRRAAPCTWELVKSHEGPVTIAFAGRPRVRGKLYALATNVRPVGGMPVLAFGLVVASLAALGGVWTALHMRSQPLIAPTARSPFCDQLESEYRASAERLRTCSDSADCDVEPFSGDVRGLTECHRFRNERLSSETTDAIADRWLSAGCAIPLQEICAAAPRAQCRDGRCVELPPPPLPASWVAGDVRGILGLHVPPGVPLVRVKRDDVLMYHWASQRLELRLEYGDGVQAVELERYAGEHIVIDGVAASMVRRDDAWLGGSAWSMALVVPATPPCPSSQCGAWLGRGTKLTLWATCMTPSDCRDAEAVMRSLRFRSGRLAGDW
jgi:hypothetical protein